MPKKFLTSSKKEGVKMLLSKEEIMFTFSGLSLFEKVLRSCPPEPTNGGEVGKRYLLELVEKGNNIKFKNFLDGLNLVNFEVSIFGHLYEVACRDGRSVLNDKFIANFFGGRPHVERVLEAMKWKDFPAISSDKLYPQKSLVSHILLPVEVVDLCDYGIDAVYRNDSFEVYFSNLIPFKDVLGELEKGKKVLCHHSSVISLASPEIEQYLLDIQVNIRRFVDACQEISQDGIDHKCMISHPWAERAGGICCL